MTDNPERADVARTDARVARKQAFARLALIVAMALGVMAVFRYTPLGDALSQENIEAILQQLGAWAIPAFIVTFGVMLALWIPGTVMALAGVAVFDTWTAVPVNYAGSILGAALGFVIARAMGGDALDALLGGRFRLYERYRSLIARRGFETIMYLRLVPTPYNAVSYLAGLSPISLPRFVLASALGTLPGSIAVTVLLDTVFEGLRSGDLSALVSWQMLGAIALYTPMALLPRFTRIARERWGWFGGPIPAEDA